MMRFFQKSFIALLAVVLVFAISSNVSGQQTQPIEFNAYLGFGEYGFDSGYIGLDEAYARMQVRAYGMLDLTLADVTMSGTVVEENGTIGVTGIPDGGNFAFNIGLGYGVYAYYGIPVLNLDYELDLLTLFGLASRDLHLNDSQSFTPFLLDQTEQISDSIYVENALPPLDLTDILFPGIPFVGAGVTLDADMELQETLSGERIYFSNPGTSIYNESSKLPFSGSSSILSYYEQANAEVIVGLWPGLYAEAFGYRFDFIPARFPITIYSADLPLAFNSSQVNFASSDISITSLSLSPSTVEPYGTFQVSGYAEYDTGDPVTDGTAEIVVESGSTYTAAVIDGSFSRPCQAPGNSSTSQISRTVTITVRDGVVTPDVETRILNIRGQGGTGNSYDLITDLIYDYVGDDNSIEWWRKDAFRTTDEEVTFLDVFENINADHDLDLMWRTFRPDGSQHFSDQVAPDAIKASWTWGWATQSRFIDGNYMSSHPGKYRVEFFVDGDRKQTHYYVVAWNFTQHFLCKDYDGNWQPIDNTNIYSPSDTRAVALHHFEHRAQGLDVRTDFYGPDGSLYSSSEYSFEDDLGPHEWQGWSRHASWIWIDDHSPEYMCGDWTINFYVKNPSDGVWEQRYTDQFRIEESTPPSNVTVSASSDFPIETQTIMLNAFAEDNNHLQRILLHWNDGSDHTQTWDNIDTGTYNGSHEIGPYSGGTNIEYWAEAWDESGNRTESQHNTIIVIAETITTPVRPSGVKYPQVGNSITYSAGGSMTNLYHPVETQFDWGDGTLSGWGSAVQPNSWASDGTYFVRAHARCQIHINRVSAWSVPLAVSVDSTNPNVEITTNSGIDFDTNQFQVTLEGTAIDPNPASGIASISINTGYSNEGTLSDWRFNVNLSPGPNVLTVTSTDNAGNVGNDTITINFVPSEPDISVDPPSRNFGDVPIGNAPEQVFVISNEGTDTLHVAGSSIEGADSDQFSIISGGGSFNLETGNTHNITVRFSPTSTGTKNASLRISSDDPDEPQKGVPISGTGNEVYYNYYVAPPPLGDDSNNNGVSAGSPFATIQHAIEIAQGTEANPITIHVAAGTYTEGLNMDDWESLEGGWNSDFSQRWDFENDGIEIPEEDIATYETIINRGGEGRCIYVFSNNGVTIDGFTIQNGNANYAAGIFIYSSSPIVRHCIISGNNGITAAGGIYIDHSSSSPNITKCIIKENNSDNGAGIFITQEASPTITDCTIIDNTATSRGGGISSYNSNINLNSCVIKENLSDYGGGIYSEGSSASVNLTNCTFTGNNGNYGGAISQIEGAMVITNSIFWNNQADSGNEIRNNNAILNIGFSNISGGIPGIVNVNGGSVIDGGGNIDENPLFVDQDGLDDILGNEDDNLHLSYGSPCVNTGTSTDTDFNDMGAFPAVTVGAGNDFSTVSQGFDQIKTFSQGGSVLIDSGVYAIPRVLIINSVSVSLFGEDKYNTSLIENDCGVIRIDNSTGYVEGLRIEPGNCDGITVVDGKASIRDCIINGNRVGIIFRGSTSSGLVKNCILSDNWDAITMYRSTNRISVLNNTISNNNFSGIYLDDFSAGPGPPECPVISNNIIANNGDYGIYEDYSGVDLIAATVTYNHFHNNIPGDYHDHTQTVYNGADDINQNVDNGPCIVDYNIDGNPLFVGGDPFDFHLQEVSTCIDAGDPASDYSQEPEPNGGRINIGAYGGTTEATTSSISPVADELALDLGASGLWDYDGTTWTPLSGSSPAGICGWSGGLAMDFSNLGFGLWNHDGTSWTPISGTSPEAITNWSGGLAMDFDALGLWSTDGTTWTAISGSDVEDMEGWANGLAMDFGALGLWNYNGSTWTPISGTSPEGICGWSGGLAMDFGGLGLWNFDGTNWTPISGSDVGDMVGWPNGLAMDYGASGLWNFDGTTWTPISGTTPEGMTGWSGGLAMDFGASGLYNYNGTDWTLITSSDVEDMDDVNLF